MVWDNDKLRILDQRRLPVKEEWLELTTWLEVVGAIRDMVVRGAPAIGVAAAYGMVLARLNGADRAAARKGLAESRPTAVNLFWALDQMDNVQEWEVAPLLTAAQAIEQLEVEMNAKIGANGAAVIPKGAGVLTICNTGSLATPGIGTALGVIRTAFESDPSLFVYSCETRPRLQGLKLTAWELMRDGIPFQSISDGMAGALMRNGKVQVVIAGADRIAVNGDTANKIGTYTMAVLAKHHSIPFFIAAPSSTLDPSMPDGSHIPIEERSAAEITHADGVQLAPTNCPVWNPGFDVTPGELISGIITESGVFRPPYSFPGQNLLKS